MRRAVTGLVGAASLASLTSLAPTARADILPSPCEVETMQRYLGERCLKCESSEYEPERCRDAYAAKNLVQRCSGSPMGNTRGISMWGEVWCLPRDAPADAALPPALPPVERDDSLPKPPPGGLPHPPTLAPPFGPPPAVAAPPAPPAPREPPASPTPPPPPPPACGCTTTPAAPWLLACIPLLTLRRRHRR